MWPSHRRASGVLAFFRSSMACCTAWSSALSALGSALCRYLSQVSSPRAATSWVLFSSTVGTSSARSPVASSLRTSATAFGGGGVVGPPPLPGGGLTSVPTISRRALGGSTPKAHRPTEAAPVSRLPTRIPPAQRRPYFGFGGG